MAKMTVTRSFNGNLDASFSTYLNLKPKDQSTTHHGAHLGCAVDDCEISIFDAQKYFNEGNNNNNNTDQDHDHQHELMKKETTKRFPLTSVRPVGGGGGITELPRFSSASSSVDTTYTNNRNSNYRGVGGARSFHHATPTASSEASWNSQTGLLSNPPGSMKVSLRNVPTTATTTTAYNNIHEKKSRSSRSSWLFGRRRCPCPCIGEKSIQVQEEKLAEPPLKTPVRSDISSNTIKTHTTTLKPPVEKVAPPNKSDRGGLIGQEQEVSPRSLEVIANPPTKFSPENHFPVSQGHHHRIVATGRSFSDNAAAAAAGFSFPILNHQKLVLNSMPLPPGPPNHPGSEDPPRESLEVFRPYDDETTSRNSSLDLLQHRDRRSFTFPASPKSRMTTVTDDDVASDASSDLFEIESFSTQTTTTTCPVLYHRRDSLEDDETSASTFHLRRRLSAATIGGGGGGGGGGLYYPVTPSSIAPTECYEPSEASIDWSVTTAEGFDKGSLTNYSIANGLSSEVTDEDTIMHEQDQNNRRRGGGGGWNGLLSCRCKKSVGVGPNLMRSALNDQQQQQHDHHQYHQQAAAAASSCTVLVKSSNNKHVPSFTNKPPLATTTTTTHSHSARLFLPFAT